MKLIWLVMLVLVVMVVTIWLSREPTMWLQQEFGEWGKMLAIVVSGTFLAFGMYATIIRLFRRR